MCDDFSTASSIANHRSMLSNAYCWLFQNSGRIARDLNHLRPIHLYLVFLETLALVYIRDLSQIASRIPKAFNLLSKKQQIHNAFQKNIKTTRKLNLVPRVLSLPLKTLGTRLQEAMSQAVKFQSRFELEGSGYRDIIIIIWTKGLTKVIFSILDGRPLHKY